MGKETITDDQELMILAQSYKRQDCKKYSYEFKKSIVEKVVRQEISPTSISKSTGVPRQTIYNWILNFSEGTMSKDKGNALLDIVKEKKSMDHTKKETVESPEEELERLRREVAHLEEALRMSELSNHAKDVLIDIAEKTFNIPIRKKSGAKQ